MLVGNSIIHDVFIFLILKDKTLNARSGMRPNLPYSSKAIEAKKHKTLIEEVPSRQSIQTIYYALDISSLKMKSLC